VFSILFNSLALTSQPVRIEPPCGLAVRRPDEAEALLAALGYRIGEAVFDAAQNAYLALYVHGIEPAVEIIWPGQTSGPIDKLIQRHASGIIYHLCYETRDLAVSRSLFEKTGCQVIWISPPIPAPLFAGLKVSFNNVVGLGPIEILERN